MLGTSLAWLRRRDPGYAALRRAARLALVASTVFYIGRYGFGSVNLATYGLFGAVATGAFAQLPGSARQRAGTLLAALPVAWVLVAAGTLLAGNTWAAAGGMLVIGFVVAFAGVGGPRLVGLATALQLFYILASFPPYQPSTLPERLGGVTLGMGLIAVVEVLLWPDPEPVTYPQRLAGAADRLAAYLDATAGRLRGDDPGDARSAAEAVAALRLAQLPPTQRPTAAGLRDRALRTCGATLQEILARAERLAAEAPPRPATDPETARLLAACADTTRAAGRTLHPGTPPVALAGLDAAIGRAETAYPDRPVGRGDTPDVGRLCRNATALAVADQVRIFAVGAGLARGHPARGARPGDGYEELFDDARSPSWVLYWRQFRAHLTPASAPAQSALRLAVALAAARVVAGTLSLMHGFWVLLSTLTILRTSAVDTRTALRPAVVGTVAGAVASGALMLVAPQSLIYAVALPVTMVLAFTLGRLLGPTWAQAMFTLLLTFVFAQLAPSGWRLAETRLENVLLGAAIGILAGVVMWPRGASRDLRRTIAGHLDACADVIGTTVEAVLGGRRPDRALTRARRAMSLADASYNQYHSERHDPPEGQVDWETALAAGRHVVYGAEAILRRKPPGSLAGWPEAAVLLRESAGRVRAAYAEASTQLGRGVSPRPAAGPGRCVDELDQIGPALDESGSGRPVRDLVEVYLWLACVAESLARLRPPGGEKPPGRSPVNQRAGP